MSKTIGNMTLKATPVGTDMVAIADSEDLDKTKKVLLSALGGGSNFKYYYELKNVAYDTINSNPLQITADCDGLTAYVPGIYVLTLPSDVSSVKGYGIRLNINGLGYKNCRTLVYYSDQTIKAPANLLVTGGVYILDYNTMFGDDVFHIIHAPTIPMKQSMVSTNQTSLSIDLSEFGSAIWNSVHKRWKITSPLTSLTLLNSPIENQGFEQEIQFTTDSTFTFTAAGLVGKWLGVSAPTFEPNTSYVIAIKNGYAVCAKVGA